MVFVDDKPVELTFKEYELLRLLMTNPSVVLSREVIMRHEMCIRDSVCKGHPGTGKGRGD